MDVRARTDDIEVRLFEGPLLAKLDLVREHGESVYVDSSTAPVHVHELEALFEPLAIEWNSLKHACETAAEALQTAKADAMNTISIEAAQVNIISMYIACLTFGFYLNAGG